MDLILKYWQGYPAHIQYMMSAKIRYEFSLLRVERGSTICDVGGGWGAFSCFAASMGMNAILVDDFADPGFSTTDPRARMPTEYRVRVIQRDVLKEGLPFPENSIDAFTSFDMLEHLHGSPKELLHQMMRCLKQGGMLIIGVPNCVNLRKRITVPLGRGKWSAMDEWYEKPIFRSHVREPDVEDLRYIARDLHLQNVEIRGTNFAGYEYSNPLLRMTARLSDRLLRLRPSLCADLYLIGQKPH